MAVNGHADRDTQRLARQTPGQLAARLGVGWVDDENRRHLVRIGEITVAEAFRVDCPLTAAATMLDMESSGGLMVFGHDPPRCDAPSYVLGGPVTRESYAAYRARRDECGAQGVGATQLTYPPFQDRADAEGGCWRPEINCRVGFDLLAGDIRKHGIRDAFSIYNTGRPGATAYAAKAMTILPRWQRVIEGRMSQ